MNAIDNYNIVPPLRMPSLVGGQSAKTAPADTNTVSEPATEAKPTSNAAQDLARFQLVLSFESGYTLVPESPQAFDNETFHSATQDELKAGFDTTSITTNLLGAHTLLYSGLGSWGREHLAMRSAETASTLFFVYWIHKMGRRYGGPSANRGLPGRRRSPDAVEYETNCEIRLCGARRLEPFEIVSGSEATEVARLQLASSMMLDGATPANTMGYTLSSLYPIFSSLDYWIRPNNSDNDIWQFAELLQYGRWIRTYGPGERDVHDERGNNYNVNARLVPGLFWQMAGPLFIASSVRSVQGLISDTGQVEDIPLAKPFGPKLGFIPATTFMPSPLSNFEYTLALLLRAETPWRTMGGQIYGRLGGYSRDPLYTRRLNSEGGLISEGREGKRFGSRPWGLGIELDHVPIWKRILYVDANFHYWDQPELMALNIPSPDDEYQTYMWSPYGDAGHFAFGGGIGWQLTEALAIEAAGQKKDQGWLPGLTYTPSYRFTLTAEVRLPSF